MGKWDTMKEWIGIPNDEEVDDFNEVEETPVKATVSEDYAHKKEAPRAATKAPVSSERSQVNMVIVKSNDYSDARTVADHILGNRAVLLNLENCNKDMAQRILDFLGGVVDAQGGDLQRVAHSTYAVTPRNVGLQGELNDESKDEEF